MDDKFTSLIRIYDVSDDSWNVSSVELPEKLYGVGLCIMGNDMHLIGGHGYGGPSSMHLIAPVFTVK